MTVGKLVALCLLAVNGWFATAEGHDLTPLKDRYQLTDAEMKQLQDANVPSAQAEKAVRLSKESGKSIEDVLKLRDSGMGWGQIAKQLGVHPGTLGGGHDKHMERKEAREARKDERREAREARKDERREAREAKRAEKKADHDNKGHGH